MKRIIPPSPLRSTDPDAIQAAQVSRLRSWLSRRVIPFSPWYRRVFAEAGVRAQDIRTPADLPGIPFTSKADLIPRPREFVLVPDEAALRRDRAVLWTALTRGRGAAREAAEREFRPLLMTSTTGRSSEPVPFLYTAHDIRNLMHAGRRIMETGASQREWKHVNLFPYAPHLAFWQAHYAGIGFGAFMVGTGGGRTLGTEGNIALIHKVKPEVIIGMPTFLYHVLSLAAAEGHRWPQIRRLVLGGEKVPPGTRRKLRALCAEVGAEDVAVIATYAFTEAKFAWVECAAAPPGAPSPGYHLWPELGIVEVIDPETGAPLGPGEPGEIVFTPLDARGTVVIRYRTGDRTDAGLTWEPCPHCGFRGPRIQGSISRVSEIRTIAVDKVKGTLVDFNELEQALDEIEGLGSWQIELRKRNDDPYDQDEVLFHASEDTGKDRGRLEGVIIRRFREVAEISPNAIHWHTRDGIAAKQGVGRVLKEERIADRRPEAGGTSAPAARAEPASLSS